MLEDVVAWLGALIRATDATLLDEWERLSGGEPPARDVPDTVVTMPIGPPPAWRTAVRTAAFGWVELLAARSYAALAERSGWSEGELRNAMEPYWTTYRSIDIDADARSAGWFTLTEQSEADGGGPGRWIVSQRLVDPDGDAEWALEATVDLAQALDDGAPTLRLTSIGPITA